MSEVSEVTQEQLEELRVLEQERSSLAEQIRQGARANSVSMTFCGNGDWKRRLKSIDSKIASILPSLLSHVTKLAEDLKDLSLYSSQQRQRADDNLHLLAASELKAKSLTEERDKLFKVAEQAVGLIRDRGFETEPIPGQGCIAVADDDGNHVCYYDGPELAEFLKERES